MRSLCLIRVKCNRSKFGCDSNLTFVSSNPSQYVLEVEEMAPLEYYQMLLRSLTYELDASQEPPCPLLRMVQVRIFSGK